MMRFLMLVMAVLLSASTVAAQAPPTRMPPFGKYIETQPVAIYGADGNIVSNFGGSGGAVSQGAAGSAPWPVTWGSGLTVTTVPASATGSVTPFTASTTSTQALAGAARRFLAIVNQSGTATLACAFGTAATATVGGAGSFDIPPGNTRTWAGTFVPADPVWCVASAAATPVTLQAN